MSRSIAILPGFAIALLLAGCTAGSNYPSLSRRPAERISGSVAVVNARPAPVSPTLPSAGFTGRLAQLVEQASDAHQRFSAERARTERLVAAAAGATVASESWAVASVALAGLESARSDAMVALAELDRIYAAEAIAPTESANPANRDAAAAARDRVIATVGEEDAVLAQLRGRFRS